MAAHDGEDDPEVYRSGSGKQAKVANSETKDESAELLGERAGENADQGQSGSSGEGENEGESEEGEDDGTLLTAQPAFNTVLIVLRDPGVLRFVKYVSANASGSRFDLCAEYEAGVVESDDEGDEGDVADADLSKLMKRRKRSSTGITFQNL